MTEHFDEDDIYKFDCDWVFLDTKKLSASSRPGAASIIFGIHMRAKLLKLMIKINKPRAKERHLTDFPWESIKKISICKTEDMHELTMILDKDKCNHTLCVVAARPEVFGKIYEVLNIVFFYLMNQRFKLNCSEICKNIRTLSALEGKRGDKIMFPGAPQLKCEGTMENMIQGMLGSYEKRNQTTGKPGPGPVTLNVAVETDKAPENDNMSLVPKDGKNLPIEGSSSDESVNSSDDNMNSSEGIIVVEHERNLMFDLNEILNVPSFAAIICTLLINLLYYVFFNQNS